MSNRYKNFVGARRAVPLLLFIFFSLSARAEIVDTSTLVRHKGFNPSRTSIAVVDIKSGKMVASYQPDLQLNPASCAKIATSAAALTVLRVDHKFNTDFYSESSPSAGTIKTLYVKGTGDPMVVNETLVEIAERLYSKGIRRITNGIVVDNSYFDSYHFPRKGGDEGRAFTAKTAATSINFNSIKIIIGPGKTVRTEPASDYFKIINKLTTGRRFATGIKITPQGGREVITVSGRVPARFGEQEFYRSTNDPALYAAAMIKAALEQRKIRVDGANGSGKISTNAVKIFTHESKPLSEIVKEMNKRSNNFIAEQILKHMGAVKLAEPGSTEKGIVVVEDYLASVGVPKGSYILENGSGLSSISRISTRHIIKILSAAYKNSSIRDEFLDSLSILGTDGTTKKWWRFAPDLHGKVLVKTGTLDGVSTLAGYTPLANGNAAAFAIFANSLPRGVASAHEAELNVVRKIMETIP